MCDKLCLLWAVDFVASWLPIFGLSGSGSETSTPSVDSSPELLDWLRSGEDGWTSSLPTRTGESSDRTLEASSDVMTVGGGT